MDVINPGRPFMQPLLLDLRRRPCLVVGGGSVAAKRARVLSGAGALVRVVAPELGAELREMVLTGEIFWEKRPFEEGDLEGQFLVVAVTGDPSTNQEVERLCRERGILVCSNAPDTHGDVLFPSVIRRGELVISVSTSGGNPSLCRMIREDLERYLEQDLSELVSLMNEVRRKARSAGLRLSYREWKEALDDEVFHMLESGRREEAEDLLWRRLSDTGHERPDFLVWGVSHKTACLEVKERLSFQPEGLEGIIRVLRAKIGSVIVLDTCNRFEVYAYAEPSRLSESVTSMVSPMLGEYVEGQHFSSYLLRGEEAIRHLLKVTCGLDSMILGEQQIRNQVRKAVKLSESVGALGDPLKGLVQKVLHTSKEIVSYLAAASRNRSVSEAAVDMVRESLGGLEDHTVLVIGTGEAGIIALRALRNDARCCLLIMGTEPLRVTRLSRSYEAHPLTHGDLEWALEEADAVINCSPRPARLLDREKLAKIMGGRSGRPLIIVDISMPRGFPEWCSEICGIILKDLRDLGEWGGRGGIDDLEPMELVKQKSRLIAAWLKERDSTPLVTRLRRDAQEACSQVVEEISSALFLEGEERRRLQSGIERLVNRILHHQTVLTKMAKVGKPAGLALRGDLLVSQTSGSGGGEGTRTASPEAETAAWTIAVRSRTEGADR